MNSLSISLALLCCSLLSAQTYRSSPRNFLTKEGTGESARFGSYPDARHMFFDGEMRGLAGSIKEVAYRPNYGVHTAIEVGRSWSRVTLYVSNCDMAKLSTTFSANPTSTPARVFGGSVAWPTLKGLPIRKPAPWSALNGHLRFPFSQPWSHTGTRDICLDYDLTGGSLANKGGWPASNSIGYVLDGFPVPSARVFGKSTNYGKGLSAGGCRDSGQTEGGWAIFDTTTYGQLSQTNPGQFTMNMISVFTSPTKPVIHVIGLGGNPTGVTFAGVTCNKLYADLAKPVVLLPYTPNGPSALIRVTLGPFRHSPSVSVPKLWFQGAWADTKSGNLLLTQAVQNAIPPLPTDFKKRALHANTKAGKKTAGRLTGDPDHNPFCRFEF